MKLSLLNFFLLIYGIAMHAQEDPLQLTKDFFKAIYHLDSNYVKSILAPQSMVHVNYLSQNKNNSVPASTFIKTMAKLHVGDLDERPYNFQTQIYDGVASVSMDYEMYFQKKFSHCGVNIFHYIKHRNEWKLTGIDYTDRNKNCKQELESQAQKLLDDWHMAATKADSAAYFSKMHYRSVFIGTDSSEVWSKEEFIKFAAPYFAKGKAWDFKKISRNVHLEPESKIIWFDEMIDTWMGPCRGSGFITYENEELLIKQYVLSVTVPNDRIKKFLELMK